MDGLEFLDRDGWLPVPHWVGRLVALGEAAAKAERPGYALRVALAVPTRSFAALLLGLGVTRAGARRGEYSRTPDGRFQFLRSLPIGTGLAFPFGKKKLRGKLLKESPPPKQELRVQVTNGESGGRVHFIPPAMALSVDILEYKMEALPDTPASTALSEGESFGKTLYPDDCGQAYLLRTRLDCAIVGKLGLLREESGRQLWRVRSGQRSPPRGCLRDALRIKQFQPDGVAFHVVIASSTGAIQIEQGDSVPPPCLVLDGATSLLRFKSQFTAPMSIAVLDRTDQAYDHAVAAFNAAIAKHGRVDGVLPSDLNGAEVAAFWEKL